MWFHGIVKISEIITSESSIVKRMGRFMNSPRDRRVPNSKSKKRKFFINAGKPHSWGKVKEELGKSWGAFRQGKFPKMCGAAAHLARRSNRSFPLLYILTRQNKAGKVISFASAKMAEIG